MVRATPPLRTLGLVQSIVLAWPTTAMNTGKEKPQPVGGGESANSIAIGRAVETSTKRTIRPAALDSSCGQRQRTCAAEHNLAISLRVSDRRKENCTPSMRLGGEPGPGFQTSMLPRDGFRTIDQSLLRRRLPFLVRDANLFREDFKKPLRKVVPPFTRRRGILELLLEATIRKGRHVGRDRVEEAVSPFAKLHRERRRCQGASAMSASTTDPRSVSRFLGSYIIMGTYPF
eukprot:5156837-Prymnesium_polylepis.2